MILDILKIIQETSFAILRTAKYNKEQDNPKEKTDSTKSIFLQSLPSCILIQITRPMTPNTAHKFSHGRFGNS